MRFDCRWVQLQLLVAEVQAYSCANDLATVGPVDWVVVKIIRYVGGFCEDVCSRYGLQSWEVC